MGQPNSGEPALGYYSASHGRLRGVMGVRVLDGTALLRAMGVLNGVGLMIMASWPKWLGRFFLETTVEFDSIEPIRHTTIIRWLGIPMMKSVEELEINKDDNGFRVTGETRMALMPWRRLNLQGDGCVNAAGTCATYKLNWLGTQFTQTTEREQNIVTLVQDAPGFSAIQKLRRVV